MGSKDAKWCSDRAQLLLGLAFLAALSGCAVATPNQASWMPSWGNLWAQPGSGTLQVETAILRFDPTDTYLSDRVWHEIDEQILPFEDRLRLETNGLRVGRLSGTLPTELREKLAAKDGHANVRRITIKGGQRHFLTFNNEDRPLALNVNLEGEVTPVSFEEGVCGLNLEWVEAPESQTTLRCEPRVRHGVASRLPKATADLAAWTLNVERPEQAYAKLAWELTVDADNSLVIGVWTDKSDTLGHALLTNPGAKEGQFYLVLLRVHRAAEATPPTTTAGTNDGPAPLVVQSLASPVTAKR